MPRLVYFAWIRERIGVPHEDYAGDVPTVGALLDELQARGAGYAAALSERALVRVALDQALVEHEAPLGEAREIAIFPPMTGG